MPVTLKQPGGAVALAKPEGTSGMDQLKLCIVAGSDREVDEDRHGLRPMVQEKGNGRLPTWPFARRVLELSLVVPLLALATPVLLVAAVLVRLSSPGPVLFRQTRVGLHGQPFSLLKLRTMDIAGDDSALREFNTRELLGQVDPGPGDGVYKLENDPRIIPIGRLLRRFSIDELPQLINVIRGEMSLVGPRPSLPWEVELFTLEQRRREGCAPGMTGLWQVSGRNRLSMPEMLALDLVYIECRTLTLDLSILLRTPRAVLFDRNTR